MLFPLPNKIKAITTTASTIKPVFKAALMTHQPFPPWTPKPHQRLHFIANNQRERQPKGYTSHEVTALRAGGLAGRPQLFNILYA